MIQLAQRRGGAGKQLKFVRRSHAAHLFDERAVTPEKNGAMRRSDSAAFDDTGIEFSANFVVARGCADVFDVFAAIIREQLRPVRKHRGKEIFAKVQRSK